ncbi:MAG: hypothetical protein LBQ28_06610 [Prevotellaceae bacterium]|jgi:hypothetical protein|nr:hypothetical protein [Prevotellaceae bacterium]
MKNLVVVEFRTFLSVGFVSAQTRLAREITYINTNQQMFFNVDIFVSSGLTDYMIAAINYKNQFRRSIK